ncbi:polysaccharide lyase family 8 super-sandwich domain-containing protein [Allorhizocola rhizosphaerae]|uniref:polysaccharide lyase family 8 super-sandwich domain-containing protein n=1 Tax=Allorhizocola rhizosphaerae TaxID=1872709 RepID=UPI000E3C0F67|nr:polysaccharide lyase family 8 super-sandwich domain-containing protein [Allorhizocola rhizosphaerae]
MAPIDTIRLRLQDSIAGPAPTVPSTLDAHGFWPDIDYADRGIATWQPATHLQRTRGLALRGHIDPALRALDAWLAADPQSENWWHNRVGAPLALGDAALLLHSRIGHRQRVNIASRLARATWDGQTGQNLLWCAQVKVRHGVLVDDEAILADAFQRAESIVRVTTEEGIQPDYSFHQHGAQLYSGGYGHEFLCDATGLAMLAADTPFAFGTEAMGTLTAFALDGQRWMVHNGRYDMACLGRENTRSHASGKARRLPSIARGPVEGARYFWRSDYLAVHRRRWSASVKLSSTRTVLPESGNGEGLCNWHAADGVTLLHRKDERDLAPVWDWRMLPGTTTAYRTGPYPTSNFGLGPDGGWVTGGSDFAGGVTDGMHGLAAMHLAKDGVTSRKAWFFFFDEYVCLGTGITAAAPVRTTIEQTTHTDEPEVRYVFPEPTRVESAVEDRTGSWADINHDQPADPVRETVFSMWIDHGVPDNATYAYIVVPSVAPGHTLPVILANTTALQAVWHPGLHIVQAVFHEPGILDLPHGDAIEVDRPLILQASPTRTDIACPLAQPGPVTIRLRSDRPGSDQLSSDQLSAALPDGPLAGGGVRLRTLQLCTGNSEQSCSAARSDPEQGRGKPEIHPEQGRSEAEIDAGQGHGAVRGDSAGGAR